MTRSDQPGGVEGRAKLLAVLVVAALAAVPASANAARTLNVGDVTVTEPDGAATTTAGFVVTLSKKAKRTVKFDYLTGSITTDSADFEGVNSTGKIRRGKKKTTVPVTVNGDDDYEDDETFSLNASNVRGATLGDGLGIGTITNNDAEPPAPPSLVALTRIGEDECVDLGLTDSPYATVVLDQVVEANTFVTVTSADPNVAYVSGGGVTVPPPQSTVQVPVNTVNEGTTQLIADLAGRQFALTITVDDDCPHAHPVINEVDYDTPGSNEDQEFVEIYNAGTDSIDLANVALIMFNGTAAQQAAEYGRYALSPGGTLDPGEFLMVKDADVDVPGGVSTIGLPGPSDDVQNGTRDGVALFNTSTKLVYDALSYENGGANGAITEALATGWPYPLDLTEGGAPTSGEDNDSTPASLIRTPNGADTNQPSADWTVATTPSRGTANPTAVLNETGLPEEADFCNVQFPASLNVQAGNSAGPVFGRIFEAGVTGDPGPGAVAAQVGYGPQGSDPRGNPAWTWTPAAYSSDIDPAGDDDEYATPFTAPAAGAYLYAYRFSLNGGAGWTYCDLNGAGSGSGLTFELNQLPTMTVTP